jgi:hypothetical protein
MNVEMKKLLRYHVKVGKPFQTTKAEEAETYPVDRMRRILVNATIVYYFEAVLRPN